MNALARRRGQPPGESRRSRTSVLLDDRPLTGEMQLMLAVLEDGLKTLRFQRGGARRRWKTDLAWIESRDREDPFSFENVCETLGIDAARLRRRLLGDLDSQQMP
jgi:hypothetical protein